MATSDGSSATGEVSAGAEDLFASLFADLPVRIGLVLRPRGRSTRVDVLAAQMPAGQMLAAQIPAAQIPGQRRYLDHDQLSKRCGARAGAAKAVQAFASRHGLKVLSVSHSVGRLVIVQGTGKKVRQAFEADLEAVASGSGHRHRARSSVPVPKELAGSVEQVLGLDTLPRFDHRTEAPRSVANPDGESSASALQNTSQNASQDALQNASQLRGVTPQKVAQYYGFPEAHHGKGQTLAILSLGGGFYEEDLKQHFGDNMPRLQVVEVAGAKNDPAPRPALDQFLDELAAGKSPTATGDSLDQLWWTLETTADIELAGSFAPEAELVVYFAPNTELGKYEGLTTVVTDQHYSPDVLSCSWGAAEAQLTASYVYAVDGIFQLAALLGITVCYSSGDKGADVIDGHPSAHFPASSPHVLGCGGTTLDPGSGVPEIAWDESSGDVVLASGGGFSQYFERPLWQAGVPDSPDGKARRGVPDVAGKADYAHGYELILASRSILGGGTSSAAPMWAGLLICLGQILKTRVGWLSPWLYSHPKALYPVAESVEKPGATGWDCKTGLGSPNGHALRSLLEDG